MLRGRPKPVWFECCLAVASALVLRLVLGVHGVDDDAPGQALHVKMAFWPFLILIGSAIWGALTTAADVTVQFLAWLYTALAAAVVGLVNGLAAAGHALLVALKRVWDFTGKLYDRVLKPAWLKFWGWFDKFTKWLDRTVGPVLRWLRKMRDTLMLWWKTWVRPWLDLIDVTRQLLRTLASFGLQWARALDQRLGQIEDAIEKPFRFVLAKLNEVIDIVNRVVTLDGLLQRVALVRSIERDYKYVWNTIKAAYSNPVTDADKKKLKDKNAPKSIATIDAAAVSYVRTGTGDNAAVFEEMYAQIRIGIRAGR